GKGPWDYARNPENLYQFWVEGAKRYKSRECIFTMGMRGQQDTPMSEGQNIELLEKIVKDQREILTNVFNDRNIATVPQVWCLYKEVQAYYEKGMRVPEDITLLWSDDNWGNIRRLPLAEERDRIGRAGVYYHFDYVGGPRNYKWLNTSPIARVWEQMHLAYQYGADRIWIVNVGDLKPMEFSISFFLKYAWDPEAIKASDLPEYSRQWVAEQFGEDHSQEIADIITGYLKFNSRRKPELLSPETYSLTNYREAETVVKEYNALAHKARIIYDSMPADYKDAFYQLVLHPAEACANLNDLYITAGMNRLYAKQGRAAANPLAERVKELFDKDAEITEYYHTELADGKWNHMMSQTHIGYTYWQQPPENTMPEVKTISLPDKAEMGAAIQGSAKWWPEEETPARLPVFDPFNNQKFYLEIFNRGKKPFEFTIEPGADWIIVSDKTGLIETEMRVWISIDWSLAPNGLIEAPIIIKGSEGSEVKVMAAVNNPEEKIKGFVESNGYISIEPEHFSKKVTSGSIDWIVIPDFGRTLSGVTMAPVTSAEQIPGGKSPHLEYPVYLFSEGEVKVNAYLAPTMNFNSKPEGICFAVSFDDEKPQIIKMTSNP
ncbi:MAG TPA: glycosyl hydrolase, partial [Caldithrix sp.]|nr:glycosyl hydrolase [Caldithrix sp.]